MLTELQVRKAQGAAKAYKLSDSGGLFLHVAVTGSRSWRLKYRHGGKEKLLTLGTYPKVSLRAARVGRDEAKLMLGDGRDPGAEKKLKRAGLAVDSANTFEVIARQWYAMEKDRWVEQHADDVLRSLERDIFPGLGNQAIKDVTPAAVLSVLRPIESRGAIETAKRIRQRMSAVFVFGIASGICDADPAAIVTKALKPLGPKGRQPAVVDLEELRALLAKVEAENASPVTLLAHRMLALTAVRSGTLREAQWEEFEDLNGDNPLWRIPASKLKLAKHAKLDGGRDHLVPLPPAAVEVLRAVKPLTGNALYVFPNHRRSHQPMSENAIGYLLNRAGYHGRHVPHGWRSAFSTIMNEKAVSADQHSNRWVIDAMLGHVPQDKVEGVYNRAEHMKRRREIAEDWADLLTEGLAPAAMLLGTARRW